MQLAFDKLEKSIIRERIAVHKKRPDGRAENEIRDISIEVGVTPRTHGSALFTRGQTQALSVVAMGTLKEEMRLDTLGLETKKYYWHHYNFPPFSVGEAGRMGGVKRRDIGHGALAERALAPMVPSIEEFPYSIRVVSDILESNGSSSMASVCGSSLSLMDAGVPIKRPVAGIAMGLIKEGDDYIVLTDIAGVEDHLGDMDFKVAGTERGITALQMDIKITGVTFDILRDALAQAKEARTFILGKMADVIGAPREQLSQFAPRIQTIQIDPSQIGLLIGKGGETIRGLSEEFESQIDVNDDGQVLIYSANGELGDALVERVRMMMKEVEVGDEYVGKVVKTTTFGAFIELAKGTDGLLHISNVSPGQRVDSVEDVLNKGDEVNVRVVEVDRERGRIGLRLAEDPDIAGKSVEELAGVGTGGGGGGGSRPAAARAARGRRPSSNGRERSDRGRDSRPPSSAARGVRATGATATDRRASRVSDEHRITTLDSGVRVVTERVPSVRSVALGFWIATGSVVERDDEAGISHLLEHMLFRGTERYGSEEIDQIFDAMGAEINAGTDKEATSLYTRVLDRHLERAFDVMSDMIWHPRFGELEAEREVVLEEIAMYEDDPQDRVFDLLGKAVFGSHPLGRAVIGTAEVVGAVTREQLAAFHAAALPPREHRDRGRRLGRPRRARAMAAQRAPGAELARGASARPTATRSPSAAAAAAAAGEPDFPPRARFLQKDTEQYHVCVGGAGIARDDERRFALRVLEGVLGGTSSSRLFQEVRERRGLAYSVFTLLQPVREHGRGRAVRGHAPGQPPRGARRRRGRARALRRGSRQRGGAGALAREPQGPRGARHGVHRCAHEPPRRLGAERAADPVRQRDDRADRRGRDRRRARARRRAVRARAGCRSPASDPTRASSWPRSSRSRPPPTAPAPSLSPAATPGASG